MEYFAHLNEAMSIKLLGLLFNSGSRTYWLFIVASCVVAALLWRPEKQIELIPRERLWSRETWFSRSAINDYGIILLNAIFLAVVADKMSPNPKVLTTSLEQGFGALLPAAPSGISAMAVLAPLMLALALFLVDDLVRYLIHYAEHRVPFLWQFHKVHHSATVLNFMTAERHHPVSIFYFSLGIMLGAAAVNGFFLALFGDHLTATTIMGGNIFLSLIHI